LIRRVLIGDLNEARRIRKTDFSPLTQNTMATIREQDKMYQFAKLCMSLTKQGLKFTRQKGVDYALTFDKLSAKRLLHPDTKTPFVEAFIRIAGDKTQTCYRFEQWADVRIR